MPANSVRKFGDVNVKDKAAIFRDYGWCSVVIADAGTDSTTVDIGPADSIMLLLPAGVNSKTIKIQTTHDGSTWTDLVSWTAATGVKVFTDATELAKVRHAQIVRFTVNSAVSGAATIWIAVKG